MLHTETLRGEVERGLFLRTNDPTRPNVQLIVHAIVRTSVQVWPLDPVQLGNRTPEAERAAVLVRRDPDDRGELRIEGLRGSEPWIEPRAERLEAARPGSNGLPMGHAGDWIVEIGLGADPPYGRHEAAVLFRTGLTNEPEFRLPVVVDLDPPVRMNEERVLIPWSSGETGAATTFLIALRSGLEPTALSVESTSPALVLQLTPLGGRHFRVDARWNDSRPPQGEIVFRVGKERYRVPIAAAAS